MQPTHARVEQIAPTDEPADTGSKVFPPVPARVARNFMVTDTYYETPPTGVSAAANEDLDPTDFLAPFRGLSAVSDEIKDLLPPDCRVAFDAALEKELEWKKKWGPEAQNASRRAPVIDKSIVPYSMQ
jgi:chromatin structure-remodeling complex protein RSC7